MIACCLLDGNDTILRAMAENVSVETFYFPANKELWEIVCRLHLTGKEVRLETVAEELKTTRKIEAVGGFRYLMQVTGKIPTTAHAGYFIETIREKQKLRELLRISMESVEKIYGFSGGFDEFFEGINKKLGDVGGTKSFEAQDLASLMAKPPKKPEEIIHGVLHRASKLVISAPSKARKTYSLIDLAIAIATGNPFWGWETVKGKVAYINFELHDGFFVERSDKICKERGIVLPKGAIDTYNLRGKAEDIEKMRPMLMRSLSRKGYSLIIFDPYYMMLGDRDENNAGDMTAMMNEFEKIAFQTNAAVVFAHHYAKGNASGKNAMDRMSGSGVISRNPDTIITMTDHTEEGCYTIDTILRYSKPIDRFVVRWKYPIYELDTALDPENLKQPAGRRPAGPAADKPAMKDGESHVAEEMLRYFPAAVSNGLPVTRIFRQASEGSGVSRTRFYKFRMDLLKARLVKQLADDKYQRTKEGDFEMQVYADKTSQETQTTLEDL